MQEAELEIMLQDLEEVELVYWGQVIFNEVNWPNILNFL
jgi:hypothetical protein